MFRVRVWCHDCGYGQDPDGCFGGESELYDEEYETLEEAEVAKLKHSLDMGSPWEYEIESTV